MLSGQSALVKETGWLDKVKSGLEPYYVHLPTPESEIYILL